jgi:predicted ATPase
MSHHALKHAYETDHAASLMFALGHAPMTHLLCGYYAAANAIVDELAALAEEKGAAQWKAGAAATKGQLLAAIGKASEAVDIMTSRRTGWRSTGATVFRPVGLCYLARAYADIGQVDNAWRCIHQATKAIETSEERWWETEINLVAGEIARESPSPDESKAQAYFERALSVARQQQAKSWELRAAMSMARLWRDQGKRDEARDLLAPVYGWFTEGFDTLDLKEAKELLDQLAA